MTLEWDVVLEALSLQYLANYTLIPVPDLQ
jgi:hypothetical protein